MLDMMDFEEEYRSMTDSAYGCSPTTVTNMHFEKYDDQWRYEIFPQDIMDVDMFKSHVKELLTSHSSFEAPSTEITYLVPGEIFNYQACDFQMDDIQMETVEVEPASPKKAFPCTLCTSSFSRNHDLKRHLRIHLGIRPYKCDSCSKDFTRLDALHRHTTVKGCKGLK